MSPFSAEADQFLSKYDVEEMINIFSKRVTSERYQRLREVSYSRIFDIHVAAMNTADIHNAYAMVRTVEALGLSNMTFIEPHKKKKSSGKRTTQGAIKWVKTQTESFDQFMKSCLFHGVQLYGAGVKGDVDLETIDLRAPICVLFGNELHGLPDHALRACRGVFSLPMYGMSQSYNLSVACGMALYDLTKRYRQEGLGEKYHQKKQELLCRFLISSVGYMEVRHILENSTLI